MALGDTIRKLAIPVTIGVFGVLFLIERRRPLRAETQSKELRTRQNLAVAGLAAAAIILVERPIAQSACALVERKRFGLLKLLRLPRWLENAAAIILLDYTLYVWHVLTHRKSCLWRFHVVHHSDLDLDACTGLRFHFGELILSSVWRGLQIAVIGVSRDSLWLWQTLLLPLVLFHHSNIELPERLERILGLFIVTPRMHGIHHSMAEPHADSNFSSVLSIWDRLHGSFRDISEHKALKIGVRAFGQPSDVTLGKIMSLSFLDEQVAVGNREKI